MKSRSECCSRSVAVTRSARAEWRRAARVLCCAVVLTLTSACGLLPDTEPPPLWAHGRFEDVEYNTLMTVIGATVEGEGYAVVKVDPGTGIVETEWTYGTSQREVRGPSRRKVLAEVESAPSKEGVPGYSVRVRVREEVIRKLGLMATDVRRSDDWEPFPDNRTDAEFLMTKFQALMRPTRRKLSDDYYDRLERFGSGADMP